MTLKNAKAKGSRNERRSMAFLAKLGYQCTKSGGSLGCWDIIGIGWYDVVLVQVKSNTWPSPAERKTLQEFVIPKTGVRKLMHRWNDHAREPLEREI